MLHLLLAALLPLTAADLHVGGLIGIQSTDLVGDDANDRVGYHADVGTTDPQGGVELGGFAEFEGRRIALRATLAYSQKGWMRHDPTAPAPPPPESERWRQRLDYLELPLEVKVMSGKPSSSVRAYLLAGGYWAGLLSARRGLDDVSNRSDWSSSTGGFSAGLGIQCLLSPARVAVQIRVRRDLAPIFELRELDVYNQSVGLDFLVGL